MVEIEKCKNDLKKLRDEMTSRVGGRLGQSIKWTNEAVMTIQINPFSLRPNMTSCFLLLLLLSSVLLVEPVDKL